MPDNSKTSQPNTSAPNTPAANKRNAQNDVITIDLVQLFYELRRHIVLLILTTIIGVPVLVYFMCKRKEGKV